MDQVSLLRPITKGAWAVPEPRLIREYLARAIDVALSGQPGPVFVEIAVDLLMSTVDERSALPPARGRVPGPRRTPARSIGWPRSWRARRAPGRRGRERRLLGRRVGCARPARRARRASRLHERHGARMPPARPFDGVPAGAWARPPRGGRGARPGDTARLPARLRPGAGVRRGGAGRDGRRGGGRLRAEPDARRGDRGGRRARPSRPRCSPVPARACAAGSGGWRRRLRDKEDAERAKQAALAASDQTPITHYRLAAELAAVMDERTCLVADGGDVVTCASKIVPLSRPAQWLDPGPLGVLGVGPPFALAAKALHPEWRVLLLSGDGAFGLNGMELETAVRFDLPLVCVVGNDGGWGMIRSVQQTFYGRERTVATSLPFTRYDRLVEALGGVGRDHRGPAPSAPGARARARLRAGRVPECYPGPGCLPPRGRRQPGHLTAAGPEHLEGTPMEPTTPDRRRPGRDPDRARHHGGRRGPGRPLLGRPDPALPPALPDRRRAVPARDDPRARRPQEGLRSRQPGPRPPARGQGASDRRRPRTR